MVYASEAELEARTLKTFNASSKPTSTEISNFLDEYSNMFDAHMGQTVGYYGNVTTAPEWVRQAVLSACVYVLNKNQKQEGYSDLDIFAIFDKFVDKKDTDQTSLFFFDNPKPNDSGEWT